MAESTKQVHVLNPFDHIRTLCQRITRQVAERVVGQEEAVEDVHRAAYPCLRHRILLNFDALADEATTDSLIRQTLIELDRTKDAGPAKKK